MKPIKQKNRQQLLSSVDHRDQIRHRNGVHIIPAEKLSHGSLKGLIPIHLNDSHHTVIYCKPNQDKNKVEKSYRDLMNRNEVIQRGTLHRIDNNKYFTEN